MEVWPRCVTVRRLHRHRFHFLHFGLGKLNEVFCALTFIFHWSITSIASASRLAGSNNQWVQSDALSGKFLCPLVFFNLWRNAPFLSSVSSVNWWITNVCLSYLYVAHVLKGFLFYNVQRVLASDVMHSWVFVTKCGCEWMNEWVRRLHDAQSHNDWRRTFQCFLVRFFKSLLQGINSQVHL